ncbi:MAG: WbqC family protein [Proteobacteria bacterium]|nr:WbqC family protein [Burkholderiales bacterium]
MTTVAIMQPYFYPYAGYFRLFARADLFVVYDCVQFPRRGWVHRNRLTAADGTLQWLTLHLAHAPQDTAIRDMRLDPGAMTRLRADLRRFPLVAQARGDPIDRLPLFTGEVDVTDYLVRNLQAVLDLLGIRCPVQRSSALALDAELRGEQRILEIAARLGATRYLNAPGGRELYDAVTFRARGIDLAFLDTAAGPGSSMLERLCRDSIEAIRAEVVRDSAA